MISMKSPPYVMDSNGRLVYTARGDDTPTLTPGAYLAKQRGCTCSRLDNAWGYGKYIIVPKDRPTAADGTPFETEHLIDIEYLITPGCPLHDNRVESDLNSQDQRSGDQLPGQPELDLPHAVDHSREG